MAQATDPQFEVLIARAQCKIRVNDPNDPPVDRDYHLAGFGYMAEKIANACNGRGGRLRGLTPYVMMAGVFVGGVLVGLRG